MAETRTMTTRAKEKESVYPYPYVPLGVPDENDLSDDIKTICTEYKLDSKGTNKMLVQRIKQFLEKQAVDNKVAFDFIIDSVLLEDDKEIVFLAVLDIFADNKFKDDNRVDKVLSEIDDKVLFNWLEDNRKRIIHRRYDTEDKDINVTVLEEGCGGSRNHEECDAPMERCREALNASIKKYKTAHKKTILACFKEALHLLNFSETELSTGKRKRSTVCR